MAQAKENVKKRRCVHLFREGIQPIQTKSVTTRDNK
jgi:hypothetical protein